MGNPVRLEFDEASHTYTLGERRLPSVTQVLKPLIDYAGIPEAILNKAAERGNYVHKCCELYLLGTLDESGIDEECAPYFQGFKKFMDETGFEPELIEQRLYHAKLMYAGTVDLGGVLPPIGRRRKPHRAMIDIKTTFKLMKSVGPQTAAYANAWASQNPKELHFDERYALQLKKDGSYKLEPMKSPSDTNTFLSCLNIHNFMTGEKS
jgi:hypothetical protein